MSAIKTSEADPIADEGQLEQAQVAGGFIERQLQPDHTSRA
ncbi:hypothetical protein ACFZAV_16975 [Streptomyces sp. NPDC008343]